MDVVTDVRDDHHLINVVRKLPYRTLGFARRMVAVFSLIAGLLCHPVLAIDDNEPGMRELLRSDNAEYSLTFENDLWFGTDRDYTNALRMQKTANWDSRDGDSYFTEQSSDGPVNYKLIGGAHIANNIYTGGNIKLPLAEIPEDDRPYAGWTYVGLSKQRVFEDDSIRKWELDIGCLGPCAGSRQIQTKIHDAGDSAAPQGWDNQIADTIALQYFYDMQFPIPENHIRRRSNNPAVRKIDFARSLHVAAGTVFNTLGVGAAVRIGKLRGYYDGIGLPGPIPSVKRHAFVTPRARERFAYARAKVRYVAHNATIEGALINDQSPFTQDAREVVLDLELGFSWQRKHCTFNVYAATRSTEIEAQAFRSRNHAWGGIQIHGFRCAASLFALGLALSL